MGRLVAFLFAAFASPIACFAAVGTFIAGDLLLLAIAAGGWLGTTTSSTALG